MLPAAFSLHVYDDDWEDGAAVLGPPFVSVETAAEVPTDELLRKGNPSHPATKRCPLQPPYTPENQTLPLKYQAILTFVCNGAWDVHLRRVLDNGRKR